MANSSKPAVKLPQWHALLLESLKSYGWSNEELLDRVASGRLPKDESKFQFHYADLVEYARTNADTFHQAVTEGYSIAYNTLRGIHSWIAVALQRDATLVVEPGSEAVIAELTAAEARRLESVLSLGWKLTVQDSPPNPEAPAICRIEPVNH